MSEITLISKQIYKVFVAFLEFYFRSEFTVQINIRRQCTNMAIEQVQKK